MVVRDAYRKLALLAVAGYTGVGCAQCIPGYYRLDEHCLKCPKGASGFIVAEAAAFCTVVLAQFTLSRPTGIP